MEPRTWAVCLLAAAGIVALQAQQQNPPSADHIPQPSTPQRIGRAFRQKSGMAVIRQLAGSSVDFRRDS